MKPHLSHSQFIKKLITARCQYPPSFPPPLLQKQYKLKTLHIFKMSRNNNKSSVNTDVKASSTRAITNISISDISNILLKPTPESVHADLALRRDSKKPVGVYANNLERLQDCNETLSRHSMEPISPDSSMRKSHCYDIYVLLQTISHWSQMAYNAVKINLDHSYETVLMQLQNNFSLMVTDEIITVHDYKVVMWIFQNLYIIQKAVQKDYLLRYMISDAVDSDPEFIADAFWALRCLLLTQFQLSNAGRDELSNADCVLPNAEFKAVIDSYELVWRELLATNHEEYKPTELFFEAVQLQQARFAMSWMGSSNTDYDSVLAIMRKLIAEEELPECDTYQQQMWMADMKSKSSSILSLVWDLATANPEICTHAGRACLMEVAAPTPHAKISNLRQMSYCMEVFLNKDHRDYHMLLAILNFIQVIHVPETELMYSVLNTTGYIVSTWLLGVINGDGVMSHHEVLNDVKKTVAAIDEYYKIDSAMCAVDTDAANKTCDFPTDAAFEALDEEEEDSDSDADTDSVTTETMDELDEDLAEEERLLAAAEADSYSDSDNDDVEILRLKINVVQCQLKIAEMSELDVADVM